MASDSPANSKRPSTHYANSKPSDAPPSRANSAEPPPRSKCPGKSHLPSPSSRLASFFHLTKQNTRKEPVSREKPLQPMPSLNLSNNLKRPRLLWSRNPKVRQRFRRPACLPCHPAPHTQ